MEPAEKQDGGGAFGKLPGRRLSGGRSLSLVAAVATLVAGIIGVALVLDRSTGNASNGGFGGPGLAGGGPGPGGYADGGQRFDSSAFQEFQQCLQEHGVTASPGLRDRGTAPTTEEREALQACSRYLPARPDFDGDGDHGGGIGPPGGPGGFDGGGLGPGDQQQTPDGSQGGSITGSVGGSDA